MRRPDVFVSYRHTDRIWLERLKVHLEALEREGALALWDDSHIAPGSVWRVEVEEALASAKVAVLLVSPAFLISDFIREKELPRLLDAARKQDTLILPVIISRCLYEHSSLGEFQPVNSPKEPLDRMEKSQWEDKLIHVAELILSALKASEEKESEANPALRAQVTDCFERFERYLSRYATDDHFFYPGALTALEGELRGNGMAGSPISEEFRGRNLKGLIFDIGKTPPASGRKTAEELKRIWDKLTTMDYRSADKDMAQRAAIVETARKLSSRAKELVADRQAN